MAYLLTDDEVKMGHVLEVGNQERNWQEASIYLALKVEEEDGEGERWLLFTGNEIHSRPVVGLGTLATQMKLGRLYPFAFGGRDRKACRVQRTARSGEREQVVLVFNSADIERARERAERNPEDVPKQSWLADKLD